MSGPAAFFVRDGDALVATELTRGPWSLEHQHGGPPAALLIRAIETSPLVVPGLAIARVTVDFLRPVPIARVACAVEVVRTGRVVQLLAATLEAGGQTALRATVLLARTTDTPLPVGAPESAIEPLPPPETGRAFRLPFFPDRIGYHTSVEGRWLRGRLGGGRAAAWMRQEVPLVEGEAPSPLQRVAVVADSASGVATGVDPARFTFVNADLTISVHRRPEGEWIGMDGVTAAERLGLGFTGAALHDRRGCFGRSAQAIVLGART